MPRILVWSLIFFFIILISVLLGLKISQPKKIITNYPECIEAQDSRIQESYPAVCITAAGERYIQPLEPSPRTNDPVLTKDPKIAEPT